MGGNLYFISPIQSWPQAYLSSTETLKLLGDLDVANTHQLSGFTQTVHHLLLEPSSLGDPQALFRYLLNITRDHPKIHSALEDVNTRISHQRNGSSTDMASHRQKRLLPHQKPQSLKDFITGNPFDPNAPPGSLKTPRIVWRDLAFGPPLRTVLSGTKCWPNSRDFVCDKNAGFYMCETYESVIFSGYVPSVHSPTPAQKFPNKPFGQANRRSLELSLCTFEPASCLQLRICVSPNAI
ncbi:hypothetical protein B0H13DRAFT_2281640 [Mycena leptocephala]|nr:hypothetical protein B0H13DRAFT_2281640 [Mycena leptocephala]